MKKTFGLIVLFFVSLCSISQVKKTNTIKVKKQNLKPCVKTQKSQKNDASQRVLINNSNYYEWAENQSEYIGKTIYLYATYSGRNENRYQIKTKERQEGGYKQYYDATVGRYVTDYTRYEDEKTYCWKSFEEVNSYKKLVVNIPEYFWDRDLLPETLGVGLYLLALKVTSEEPTSICSNGMVSSSEIKYSKSVYYVLSNIWRYDDN